MIPPSPLPRWLRLKPVAIFWSRVALRQHVARELFDGEAVERQIPVKGVDHPVAPPPHHAGRIGLIPVRVGVPRCTQPAGCEPFAQPRRGEQAIDDFLVSVPARVAFKGVDLIGVGGSPVKSNVTRRIKMPRSA